MTKLRGGSLVLLRFLGFDLGAPTPDRNTIWTFRQRLTKAGTIDDLFVAFKGALRAAGYLPMGGQIVDAALVSAPRQHLTRSEKAVAQAGESAEVIWPGQPAKAAQKDLDARWTVKTGRQLPAIAISVFGYKNHVAIDRAWGFIRRSAVTDAPCYDGSMLRELVTSNNLAASVWADTAYRSAANEAWPADLGRVSRIHRKKPPARPMPRHLARGARSRRARLRPTEGTDGPLRSHYWAPPSPHLDRPSQPRLQLPAPRLPRTPGSRRLSLPRNRQTGPMPPIRDAGRPVRRPSSRIVTGITPDSRPSRCQRGILGGVHW